MNSKILQLIKDNPRITYKKLSDLLLEECDKEELASFVLSHLQNSYEWKIADGWECIEDLTKQEWQKLGPKNMQWLVMIGREEIFVGNRDRSFVPGFEYTPLFSNWPNKPLYMDAVLQFAAPEMTRKEISDHLDMGGTVRYRSTSKDSWSAPQNFVVDLYEGVYEICDRSGNFCRNLYKSFQ